VTEIELCLGLSESAEYSRPRQQFGQNLDSAASLRRIDDVGGHAATAHGGELTRNLRVISCPVGAQQDIVPGVA
jgi:hypothetical protein